MLDYILVPNPVYALACDITDREDGEYFAPLVAFLSKRHGIEFGRFDKINGWANLIFDLDGKFIIKVAAPNWALQSKREIEALKLLSTHSLPTTVPKLLHHGEINGWVYFITDKLPGTNLHDLWKTLDFETQKRLISQVGTFARAFNDLAVEPQGLLYENWDNFLAKQSAGAYERRKKQGLSGPLLEDINPFLAAVNYQSTATKPMLIHCDLHAGNLLVEQIDGLWQLSGVIDFGDTIISTDSNYEMTATCVLMGLGNKRLNQAFFDSYGKQIDDVKALQQALMVLCIIRHSGEMGYVLDQVEGCAQLPDWQSVAERFFAL